MSDIEFKEGVICYAIDHQWCLGDKIVDESGGVKSVDIDVLALMIDKADFKLNEPRTGDYIPKSELDTEQKYNDAVEVFKLFGFEMSAYSEQNYDRLKMREFECLGLCDAKLIAARNSLFERKRKITYNQLMVIGKLNLPMNERENTLVKVVKKPNPQSTASFIKLSDCEIDSESREKATKESKAYDLLKSMDIYYDEDQELWYKKGVI